MRLDYRTVDDVCLPVFRITISEAFRKGVACDFQLSNLWKLQLFSYRHACVSKIICCSKYFHVTLFTLKVISCLPCGFDMRWRPWILSRRTETSWSFPSVRRLHPWGARRRCESEAGTCASSSESSTTIRHRYATSVALAQTYVIEVLCSVEWNHGLWRTPFIQNNTL